MTKKLRHGSLFAGIVGFSRGRRKDFGHGTRLERCILAVRRKLSVGREVKTGIPAELVFGQSNRRRKHSALATLRFRIARGCRVLLYLRLRRAIALGSVDRAAVRNP